jgi:pyruvate kinase
MGQKIIMVSKYYDEYSKKHKLKKDQELLPTIYLLNCENFRNVANNSQVFFDNGNISGVIAQIDTHLVEVVIKNDGWIYESQKV